jgi:1-acyl-sn-glycerol-3-phosphate acyltransferase
MKAKGLRDIIIWLIDHLTDTQVNGAENIPTEGGLLICTNHMSRLDIPVLFTNPKRAKITALVTTKYLKYPLLRWFIVTAEGIWLDRDTADFAAIHKAIEKLDEGYAVGISPGGTRSSTCQLLEAKPGAAMLALRAQVPIQPVALIGTEIATDELKHLRKPHIRVEYGKLIQTPKLDRNDREGQLKWLTTEIMCQIAAMMPEKYHGFYKNHPRLLEILAECENPPHAPEMISIIHE